MNKLLLIGCGGHAKSIIDVVENKKDWQIGGLIGFEKEIGKKLGSYRVIGSDNNICDFRDSFDFAFVAIGSIKNQGKRERIFNYLLEKKFEIPVLSSRNAYVSSNSIIGKGTFLSHGVVVNSASKIGNNCIVNSKTLLEHDVEIGDNCHISTGVIINGGCKIGNNSFIGSGAILRENIKIPPNTIISAGKRIMGWPLK